MSSAAAPPAKAPHPRCTFTPASPPPPRASLRLGEHGVRQRRPRLRRPCERLARNERRTQELASEGNEVVEIAVEGVRRGAAQLRAHPERLEDGGAQVLLERHLRTRGEVPAQRLEARVRVDSPRAR